ncbi:hypothetical protein AAZX31_18G029600 [Glycine max]
MGAKSDSSRAILFDAENNSKSTVPPPFLPGNADILPSNLFAPPLRTAKSRPHPKSLSYIGNLGELPICTEAPSWFPSSKHFGWRSQFSTLRFTVALSNAFTLLFSCSAHQRSSLDATLPAFAT